MTDHPPDGPGALRPHNGTDGSHPVAIDAAVRAALIVKMKREGKTFAAIAEHLEISRTRVHEIFHKTLRALPVADVQDWRTAELERLEFLRSKAQEVIDRRHYLAYQGVITNIEEDGPLLQAIETDRRISESIRKLVGADAPVRTEAVIQAVARYEIVGVPLDEV